MIIVRGLRITGLSWSARGAGAGPSGGVSMWRITTAGLSRRRSG